MTISVATQSRRSRLSLWRRLAAYWPIKLLVGGAITIGFCAAYLLLQRHPLFPVTQIPATGLDQLIGFHPEMTLLYLSLWLYIPFGPWLSHSKREVVTYAIVTTAMCALGLLIFLLFPSAIARPAGDSSQPLMFQRLVAVDGIMNACPSLHAAFVVFSGWCNRRTLLQLGDRGWLRTANWCWGAGILYATLATKQHVVIDLICGASLGGATAAGYAWLLNRSPGVADDE